MGDERERVEILRMLLTVAESPHAFIDLVQSCGTHREAIAAVEAHYGVPEGVARAGLAASFRYVTREQIGRLRGEIAELENPLLPE